jgi:D-arginine dehydrogenase
VAAFDFAVVGGGIAGVSVGFELAALGSVVLLEAEASLAYHTTGRSAATFLESYGSAPIRALARASRPLFDAAPESLGTPPILAPLGLLWIASEAQTAALARTVEAVRREGGGLELVTATTARTLVPVLGAEYVAGGAFEPNAQAIDVMGLHQGYVRGLIARGGVILRNARVQRLERSGDGWLIGTASEDAAAGVVVNAAGAWADRVAALAGLPPAGVTPLRRTLAIAHGTFTGDARGWPGVLDADERFYFLPEGGGFLISPADETPSEPVDARPEEQDVAPAMALVNDATTLGLTHVTNAWAGLRSFAGDRNPVVGFDPHGHGFFWLAGQGGYGIMMSAALAEVAAALAAGAPIPTRITREGLQLATISIERLRGATPTHNLQPDVVRPVGPRD